MNIKNRKEENMNNETLLKEFEKKGFDPMLNEIVLGKLAFVLKTLKKYKELRKIPYGIFM